MYQYSFDKQREFLDIDQYSMLKSAFWRRFWLQDVYRT